MTEDASALRFGDRGEIWRATREQEISTQTWKIPREKININVLKDGVEENVGVYAKEQCSIPAGMGKYIPVQTNREIQGDVLVEISDKTVTGLILPEIVYNVKKKLGCIFIENHNSEPLDLQRGQTIGFVTSCLVMQKEVSQQPEKRKDNTQSITGRINDEETRIGGASVWHAEKASRKAVIVQSLENRQCYETEDEKQKFIIESFQLDTNAILNTDAKFKEAVIK